MTKISNKYDVIIIGAGIGGLVSGCYLAKAGMNVLIVEQHMKVGGYCRSFIRDKFKFDIGAHCFGSFREEGQMRRIYTELNLSELVDIIRIDPSEIVHSPDNKLYIYNDIEKTIDGLSRDFSDESSNIKRFFNDISNIKLIDNVVKLKKKSFKDYIDLYFANKKLKYLLSTLVWNMWMPTSKIAGLAGIVFFREFILDGGYYPIGGMQAFSNALAKRFRRLGGALLLSEKVTKILIDERTALGIKLNKGHMEAKYIVSNADAIETYFDLIDKDNVDKAYLEKLSKLKQCRSAFVVYLGVKKIGINDIEKCTASWYLPNYRNDWTCFDILDESNKDKCFFMFYPSLYDRSLAPIGYDIVIIVCGASYKLGDFWKINKFKYRDLLIKKASKVFPNLSSRIVFKDAATPATLEKYTSNYKGAVHGWESSNNQTNRLYINCKSPIKNLYFASQWLMQKIGTGGISTAAYIGKNTAKQILKDSRMENSNEYIFSSDINM